MTEPAHGAAPTTYVRDTLALLGDRDPVQVLAETPQWILHRIGGVSPEQLRQPEGDGKWSLTDVLAHLTDTEIAYGWRLRLVLTQENAPLQGFDQTAWVTRFAYAASDPMEALSVFTALRGWNLHLWRSASPADLERMAIHAERGPESFDTLRRLNAGHDLRHRRQVDRILATLG